MPSILTVVLPVRISTLYDRILRGTCFVHEREQIRGRSTQKTVYTAHPLCQSTGGVLSQGLRKAPEFAGDVDTKLGAVVASDGTVWLFVYA